MTKELIERIEYQIPILETNDEYPTANLLQDCKTTILALQGEVERLRGALEGLLDDTQHQNHFCGDEDCPVWIAQQAISKVEG